jgi:transposase
VIEWTTAARVDNEDLGSAHTRAREVRSEVLTGLERRRWSFAEKLRILGQSVVPGSSAALVCRLHGISSGQLYTSRRQFRTGELIGFAPVRLVPPVEELAMAAVPADLVPTLPEADPAANSIIEVELPLGMKLRLVGAVGEVSLRRVVSALL